MRPSQEWDKLVDNAVNQVAKLMEKWDDRLTLDNLRIAERYLKNGVEIHVHVRPLRCVDSADFCAVLKYREVLSANRSMGHDGNASRVLLGRITLCPCDAGGTGSESGNDQEAVFVNVVKLAQFPERIVPTLVRLILSMTLIAAADIPFTFPGDSVLYLAALSLIGKYVDFPGV